MDEGTWINSETNSVWICSKTNLATDMAIAENLKKEDLTDEQIVPPEYHKYLDIFDEKWASWIPDKWPWDHKIEMKPGFEPKSFKNYNLTPAEHNTLPSPTDSTRLTFSERGELIFRWSLVDSTGLQSTWVH